jgi:predicted Na+-dependent transporter
MSEEDVRLLSDLNETYMKVAKNLMQSIIIVIIIIIIYTVFAKNQGSLLWRNCRISVPKSALIFVTEII